MLTERTALITYVERMDIFLETGVKGFTRKDYMNFFKAISSATASRDLRQSVKESLIKKVGDKIKLIIK